MAFNRNQTWQVVNQNPLTVLETSTREPLDNLNKILDNKLDYPFRVSLNGNILTINGSEIQTLKSDGVNGTVDSFKIAASPIQGRYKVIASSTLNLATGVVTGDFATGQTGIPTASANQYVYLGLELRTNGKFYFVWGTPAANASLATLPIFTSGDAVCLSLLQRTSAVGTSPWNFSNPLASNIVLFKESNALEIREDAVHKAKVIDLVSTVLPTGTVLIDGTAILADDMVLFTQSAIEGYYRAVGTTGNITSWDKVLDPKEGINVQVTQGTSYLKTIWKRIGIWKPLEVADAVKEASGFPNRNDSAISFVDATRTFTIQPSSTSSISGAFDYFNKGAVHRVNSSKTLIIPNVIGSHFIYFIGATLSSTTSSSTYETLYNDGAMVAQVYWDGNKAIILGDERHGISMDAATHKYLHMSRGTVLQSGLAISGHTTSGTGSADTDAQITLSQGRMFDEDIDFIIDDSSAVSTTTIHKQILNGGATAPAQIPMFYRTGATGTWTKSTANTFPVLQSGSTRAQINKFLSGSWSVSPATADEVFITTWVFATNSIIEPVIGVVGQNEYATLSTAQQDETYSSLSLGDFPSSEFKLLYRLIWQTNATYANTPNVRMVHIQDLRVSADSPFPSVSPHDHGLLSGLADADHAPTAVTTLGVELDGGFSASDIDVKEALNTLNSMFGQMRLKRHSTITSRVNITGATRTLNNGTKLGQAIGLLLIDFDGAQIDFSTGLIYKADGVTSLGALTVPLATIPINQYMYYSITVVANAVTDTNKMTAQVLVVASNAPHVTSSSASYAPFAPGLKLGQVMVRSNGSASGAIADISQSDIIQLGVGSGGGSDSTGDANELLERLKDRFEQSDYEYLTPNIFSTTTETETNRAMSTATYSVVNNSYNFSNVGSVYQSKNSLDTDYLSEAAGSLADIESVELLTYYALSNIDTKPVVQLSRDGGNNWQTANVSRIGTSDTFRGVHNFSEEPSQSFLQNVGTVATSQLALTNLPTSYYQRTLSLAEATVINKISASISVSGAPAGNIKARIIKSKNYLDVFDNSWQSVAFGGGRFVGVATTGNSNSVMSSSDNGLNWRQESPAVNNAWRAITYGNGLFVAVSSSGTSNRVMTSVNGQTWTSRTSASNNDWVGLTYGGNLFVAVSNTGLSNRVMTSPDGITWTSRASAANYSWFGVAYGNSTFVAVSNGLGEGTNRVMTSSDGITWTLRTAASDSPWRSVTFGNGVFVAVATNGSIMTSVNGIVWVLRTSDTVNSWRSVTFGNNTFVVVSGAGSRNMFQTSSDGIAWSVHIVIEPFDSTEPPSNDLIFKENDWSCVTFGNNTFVAVSETGLGNRSMYSSDAIKWTSSVTASPVESSIYSLPIKLSGLSSGVSEFKINAILSPGVYYVMFETDADYKANYVAGINQITLGRDSTTLNTPGSTLGSASALVFSVSGRRMDLVVKIISGTADSILKGYGILYKKDSSIETYLDIYREHKVSFYGITENLNEFTLPFQPDKRLLNVFEIGTGQVYKHGTFAIDGSKIIFPLNTFQKAETITLLFEQISTAPGWSMPGTSDKSYGLLVANSLGSSDPNLDLSVPGRGIMLRRPDGSLRELTIDDDDNIAIYSV